MIGRYVVSTVLLAPRPLTTSVNSILHGYQNLTLLPSNPPHTHTYACTHTRTHAHARTHARTHAHAHIHTVSNTLVVTCVLGCCVASTVLLAPRPLTTSVNSCAENKECPFSGVTSSDRVWRKVPESDAQSVVEIKSSLHWRNQFSTSKLCQI